MKLERAREFRRLSLTGDNALQLHLQESEKLKAEYAGIAAAAGFTKNLELHAVIDDRSLRAELNAHDEVIFFLSALLPPPPLLPLPPFF